VKQFSLKRASLKRPALKRAVAAAAMLLIALRIWPHQPLERRYFSQPASGPLTENCCAYPSRQTINTGSGLTQPDFTYARTGIPRQRRSLVLLASGRQSGCRSPRRFPYVAR